MRRGVVLTLIAAHALAVAVLITTVGWTHGNPRPCLKTFERVQVGMTREQVEATVGGPPGNYSSADWGPTRAFTGIWWTGDAEWTCNASVLQVWYKEGRVREAFVGRSLYVYTPSRGERVWSWTTTGYDSRPLGWGLFGVEPYNLDVLRDILRP